MILDVSSQNMLLVMLVWGVECALYWIKGNVEKKWPKNLNRNIGIIDEKYCLMMMCKVSVCYDHIEYRDG